MQINGTVFCNFRTNYQKNVSLVIKNTVLQAFHVTTILSNDVTNTSATLSKTVNKTHLNTPLMNAEDRSYDWQVPDDVISRQRSITATWLACRNSIATWRRQYSV